jgi:transcriptional regulator with XRE-family HTH domain
MLPNGMEKDYRAYVLALAREYAKKRGLALTTVARRIHGKESFFSDFEAGRCSITVRKLEQMFLTFGAPFPQVPKKYRQ